MRARIAAQRSAAYHDDGEIAQLGDRMAGSQPASLAYAISADVPRCPMQAMVTSPIKPMGDGGNENGINNSAVTPNESVRTPGPVATPSTEPADGRTGAPQQGDLQITDFLGGKCYLVTGITGFMGTVLVSPRCSACADHSSIE